MKELGVSELDRMEVGGLTKRNVYIGLHLLYVWGKLVYVRWTIDLRTEGCTFTRVAFFVCVWVNPLYVGV